MRYILLLLVVSLQAQVTTFSIRDVEYQIVDGMEYYTTPRPNLNPYSDIDIDNLDTYVHAFVKDAILSGKSLDLSVSGRSLLTQYATKVGTQTIRGYEVTIADNSVNFVDGDGFYLGLNIGGSSWNSVQPGFRITINRDLYYTHTSYQTDTNKRELMYHELGHALLHRAHVCSYSAIRIDTGTYEVPSIMSTGSCGRYFSDWNPGEVTGYDMSVWKQAIQYMYDTVVLLPRASISSKSKTPNVIHN